MRFSPLVLCAAALLLLAPAAHAAGPADALASTMQKRYGAMRSFSAAFTQVLTHGESGAEERRTGTILFAKPFRLRWETGAPSPEVLVINEREVWDYVPDEATAYRYAPEVAADSASVVQVVTGQSRLDKDFSVERQPDENGLAVLQLYPREPSAQMVEATLWADKTSGLIRRVRILDFYGNSNDMSFTRLTPDAPAPESAFRFTPPGGVTVEDLQHQSAPERPLLR